MPKEAQLITVTMLKNWGNNSYTWLHVDNQYDLDYHFATMLINTGKAKFTGEADQLFKQSD